MKRERVLFVCSEARYSHSSPPVELALSKDVVESLSAVTRDDLVRVRAADEEDQNMRTKETMMETTK